MIKKFSIKRILGAVLAATILCAGAASPIYAEDNGKLHIQISPVIEKLELSPGDTHSGTVIVRNIGDEAFDYNMTIEPYYISDDKGTPNYDDMNEHTQIVDWITLDKEKGHLESGEDYEIGYTIKVPNNAPGGGQYAAIIAQSDNEAKNLVQTTTRVAELIYAEVDGDINECVKILDNNVNTFMFEPPITANSLVENCGNVHADVSYTMKVYPLFSGEPIYTNEEKPDAKTILPDTRRFYTTSWTKEDGAPSMGIYNVEQTVKIGKETSTIKKLVFIFPLWLLIVFLLLICAIIFWLVTRSRQRKESKPSPDKSSNSSRSSD